MILLILLDKNIILDKILFDEDNPRFLTKLSGGQSGILTYLTSTKEYKSLIKSMKKEIKWINRIVVKPIDDKYIVVEGNHRLACLKSGDITTITENTEIPVLIAVKEDNESEYAYQKELKVIQGIANVLVVNEWSAEAKARHIYERFIEAKTCNPNSTNSSIIKDIAESLSSSTQSCKKSINQYLFYKRISECDCNTLREHQFSYLEGVCYNPTTRSYFGFNDNLLNFSWSLDELENSIDEDRTNEIEKFKERLELIPQLILTDNIKATDFRNKFPKLINKIENSQDSLSDEDLKELSDNRVSWNDLLQHPQISASNEWFELLKQYNNKLSSFPVLQDWAKSKEFKEILSEISETINTIRGFIENNG